MASPPQPSAAYRFVAKASKPAFFGLLRLRAIGLENVPRVGGFVLAANHVSNLDGWPLGLTVYPRALHFMAKAELYKPLLAQFLNACGTFPVRRGERDPESYRTAVRLAREGGAVVMFPEGTRRDKGLLKRREVKWHPGAARIALAAGVPLVPAAITGMDRLRRLGPVRVAYGPPVETADLADLPRKEAAKRATERLMAAIEELETFA